ncbi:hypothetical protein [Pelagirhabdus alkalitolerans]|nr:hypothetical protein [Pelagirhabdus alkalitolerans]
MNVKESYYNLKSMFNESMTVELLTEPLQTCRLSDDAEEMQVLLEAARFDHSGVVNDQNEVIGYIDKESLGKGYVESYIKPFKTTDLISNSTSMIDLIYLFHERDVMFVLERNQITGIVTSADLHKHPVRLLAFSLISILEMALLDEIKQVYRTEKEAIEQLPSSRSEMVYELYQERLKSNKDLKLLDNLQLADKGELTKRTDEILEKCEFHSRNQCERFFSDIEKVRNNIAHAQTYIGEDHNAIIRAIVDVNMVLKNLLG